MNVKAEKREMKKVVSEVSKMQEAAAMKKSYAI